MTSARAIFRWVGPWLLFLGGAFIFATIVGKFEVRHPFPDWVIALGIILVGFVLLCLSTPGKRR